jgi:hypothetical protein
VRYFGRRRVLDIYGNNDTELAKLLWADDEAGVVALLSAARPDALVAFPLQYAVMQSGPEWEQLRRQYADRPQLLEQLAAYVQATGDAFATGWGLTRRAAIFHVDESVTVDSPIHQDLVVFVRP